MGFSGRESELDALNAMYRKDSFQMMVIYGRRRVGTTALINEFVRDKDPLFYTGIEGKDEENLKEFGNTVFSYFSESAAGISFHSYADILNFMTDRMNAGPADRRYLIGLDEYPYIAGASLSFASILQREIDTHWKDMNVMLILCGSSITFMENKVLGEKSPLYGRRTGQIDLKPLDYQKSALFTPEYSAEEKAIIYGITGGIPKYLEMIDPSLSLQENIQKQFFTTSGYFFEEPKNLLRQEFRNISLYHTIIGAVSRGNYRITDISSNTGLDTPTVSQAVEKLKSVRLIRKDVPVPGKVNKKQIRYVLQDGMFRFWFRFVPSGLNAIERRYGKEYFNEMVLPHMHEYMGSVFEEISQDYTFLLSMKGKLGITLTDIGKWRGSDPLLKHQTDIDVVGINEPDHTAVIGKCKFKNEPIGKTELDTLMDRARLVQGYTVER